jgi:hypothetical protein
MTAQDLHESSSRETRGGPASPAKVRQAATNPIRRTTHALQRLPATVPVAAGLLVICAVVMLEHARRLFSALTMAEETLGLSAIAPLRHEVPAGILEVFAGVGLLICAGGIVRRSRLALIFGASVQAIIALDAVLRIVRGLAVAPAIALLVLAAVTGGTLLAASTRAWCDEPVRQRTAN